MVNQPTMNTAAELGLYRTEDDQSVWPHRGKVAAVGIGHAPTQRRWDGDPQTSVGAGCLMAVRNAIADAGVSPADVDGLVFVRDTNYADPWPQGKPIPEDFAAAFEQTSNPVDGLAAMSGEWLVKNLPELTGLTFVLEAPFDMSMAVAASIEAVARGMGNIVVAVRGWHVMPGAQYGHTEDTRKATVEGPAKYGWNTLSGGPTSTWTATHFQRYMHKYGGTHEMLAPFVVNARKNGLLMPEGYWAQHRPEDLTIEEYNASRWIAEPMNLLDNDIPIMTANALLFTTSERAADMAQPPVYILGHAAGGEYHHGDYRGFQKRSMIETLEEMEEWAARTANRLYRSAGITNKDVQFENANDGFAPFHMFWIEGFEFFGVKKGECLDFFQTDISIHGPTPVNTGGGNLGNGRTRYWMWTDTMQQLQGRAGERQMKIDARLGVAGGFTPYWSNFAAMSKDPV
jgi:acetyl-CoA acetyltransferase